MTAGAGEVPCIPPAAYPLPSLPPSTCPRAAPPQGFYSVHAIPIIENTARECELTDRLRAAIEAYPQANAVLVRRHGVYVWGKNWIEAKTQVRRGAGLARRGDGVVKGAEEAMVAAGTGPHCGWPVVAPPPLPVRLPPTTLTFETCSSFCRLKASSCS